jgi:hypothetical protein
MSKWIEFDAYEVQSRFAYFGSFWAGEAVRESYFRDNGQLVISDGQIRQICRDLVRSGYPASVEAVYRQVTDGLSAL